jgi:N6-adenosine-specific RNA methylase IME4
MNPVNLFGEAIQPPVPPPGYPPLDLPMFKYQAILADPPWQFENYSQAGERKSAKRHYETMPTEDIAALPVGHLASRDCVLFLWAVAPMLRDAFRVMDAWGFEYKTIGFTWAKRSRRDRGWHMGPGYWTRANGEICLLGTTGQPKRKSAGVRSLIVDPVREHSRKPDCTHERIERLVPGPYAELFARTRRIGWDSWGKEVGKFDAEYLEPK